MSRQTHHLRLADQQATHRFAQRIAPHLQAGDVLLLEGAIGAGKTFLARSVIQTRLAKKNRVEDVPSPTYTLVQTYDDGEVEIWHADLYRLSNTDELAELGLEDAFDTAICLVEWPDRMDTSQLRDPLKLSFVAEADDARLLTAEGSPEWTERLKPVLDPANA